MRKMGENGDSALFFLLKIGRCPHFPSFSSIVSQLVIAVMKNLNIEY